MDSPRTRIQELAAAARAVPSAQRAAWIESLALDAVTRAALLALLDDEETSAMPRGTMAAPQGPKPDLTLPDRGATLSTAQPAAAPARAAAAMDPMVGTAFAGVQVERILGSGGMGRVYLGTDLEQQRRVALKVLLRTQRDESVRKRFDREARLLEKLRHPSIAAVLRTGVEQDADVDIPYIVMEYVEGVQTVADWTFRERLGAREAVELLLQACDGVGHAHREGYIHRDLKPANILVDRHGRVKVIDFGVARAVSVDPAAVTVRTETGQIVGTMQYMSPEQFRADPRAVDARTDVYALGAVLYELLTGVQPHELRGAPVHEAARIVCETDAPDVRKFNPRVDARLAAIVADALAREPSRRPDDANALALRLRGWLAGDSTADETGIALHPDAEFRAQSGVVRGDRAAIAGLGGGGGGVRAAPAVHAAPSRGAGSWFLVAVVALAAVAAVLVAFDVVPLAKVVARLRGQAPAPQQEQGGAQPAAPAGPAPAPLVAELRIVSAPGGAEVRVGGEPRGRTPGVVLVPHRRNGESVAIDLRLAGWKDAQLRWTVGSTPIVAVNLEPAGAVPDALPRILTLDVGALPAGASLRLVAPERRDLQAGTWCVEVPFRRAGAGWSPASIELEARDAAGAPLGIELGTRDAAGTARLDVRPEDAASPVRVRVHALPAAQRAR